MRCAASTVEQTPNGFDLYNRSICMDIKLIGLLFLTLTVMWGLIIFIYYGDAVTIGEYIMLDVLPVSLLLLAYAGFKYALVGVAEKEEVPVAKRTKLSAIELYEMERAKAEQEHDLPYEITSRLKSSEAKTMMNAAREVLKRRKKDIDMK